MPLDVPAHITAPAYIQNGVKVQSGTNWDFSRAAVATPLVALADPVPPYIAPQEPVGPLPRYRTEDRVPNSEPSATISFPQNQVTFPGEARISLRRLEKGIDYVVVGHAADGERNGELLSRKRANGVAAQMKRRGLTVTTVKSFGDRRPISSAQAAGPESRRVEIIRAD